MKTLFCISVIALSVFVTGYGANDTAYAALHGFTEFAYGPKLSDDNTKRDDFNLLEQRLQLRYSHWFEGDGYFARKGGALSVKGDFTVDGYFAGKTGFELRECNLSFAPFNLVDLKVGRQVLTWGTGDYLFVNDVFPKDYVSFFIGRDDEYLKKPSDALRASFYPAFASIEVIAIPYFTPNTHAKGDRLSFYDSFRGGIAGVDSDRHLVSPAFRMSNNEYAVRVYRNFGSTETAFYYFRGFDKSPRSYDDEARRRLYYQRLDVYGASARGPFLGGIGNIELGYYYSREDPRGTNRLIENSLFKTLIGYAKDLGNDWRVGLQYLLEQRLNYGNYLGSLIAGSDPVFDEFRHLVTTSISKLYKNQTVAVSVFTFYSPSGRDGYLRPSVSYDISDQWKATAGANIPWGTDETTEFGQMRKNKNVYLRLRYSF